MVCKNLRKKYSSEMDGMIWRSLGLFVVEVSVESKTKSKTHNEKMKVGPDTMQLVLDEF